MDYIEYKKLVSQYDSWSSFYENEKSFFQNSCYPYKDISEFTPLEISYLDLLSKSFNVESPQSVKVPYMPFSWQIDYHLLSLNLKKEKSKKIFIEKPRGISYTISSIIEAIITMYRYPGTQIPFISKRYDDANKFIKYARTIADIASVDINYNKDKSSEFEVKVKDKVSRLVPFPAGDEQAANSIRGLLPRPVRIFIDEGAYIRYLRVLRGAAEKSMQGLETQLVIGSTHQGVNSEFYEMSKEPLESYVKLSLKGFNDDIIPSESLIKQKAKPLVWWYDISKIDGEKNDDLDYFMQEYMCSPLTGEKSYLNYNKILDAITREPFEFDNYYNLLGVDVALKQDYAFISKYKTDGKNYLQTDMWYKKNIDTLELENKITEMGSDCEEVRIDSTGQGLPIYQRLFRTEGSKIKGINFRETLKIPPNIRQPIKPFMANNLKRLLDTGAIVLKDDSIQTKQLLSVNKNLSAEHTSTGHGDAFWANALALLPLGYKIGGYSDQEVANKSIGNDLSSRLDDLFNNKRKFKNRIGKSSFVKV